MPTLRDAWYLFPGTSFLAVAVEILAGNTNGEVVIRIVVEVTNSQDGTKPVIRSGGVLDVCRVLIPLVAALRSQAVLPGAVEHDHPAGVFLATEILPGHADGQVGVIIVVEIAHGHSGAEPVVRFGCASDSCRALMAP